MFIQYERDEEKASELFKETVVEIMSSEENGLDSNLLCLAARYEQITKNHYELFQKRKHTIYSLTLFHISTG